MGFFVFITVFIMMVYSYIGIRMIGPLTSGPGIKILIWMILIFLSVIIPTSFFIRINYPTQKWHDLLAWIAYLSFGFFSLLATVLLLKDMGLWGAELLERHSFLNQQILPADPSRRIFLLNSLNAATLGLATFGGLYGFIKARKQIVIENVAIKIKDLHPDLVGFRIVQISDIHIGPTIKYNIMNKITQKVNSLNADMVAITGDIVDGPVSHLEKDIDPISRIKSKFGSYYVTGNHEYYSGALSWIQKFKNLGLIVLQNEHKIIRHKKARLLIAGVSDLSAEKHIKSHKSDPHKAIQGAKKHDYKLLLAHQPRSIYKASQAGFDLQLSGHTHGGQYFPGNILVHLFQPFVRGLGLYKDTQIYVNRGTGYWGPPLRIGSDPEITLLVLERA